MAAPGNGLITEVRAIPQPLRYLLLAAGFFVLAIAGVVTGTVADAHHMSWLSHLATIPAGVGLALVVGMLRMSYITGVRVPSLGRQLSAMVEAVNARQAVTGSFLAGLRDVVPTTPITRWKRGKVLITPQSVIWTRRITGRERDLAGTQCTGERKPDLGYTDVTLRMPSYYKGENLRVIRLRANGTEVELAAPAQLLEIFLYSLARTTLDAR
jgi:hypothetical protein